MYEGFDVRRQGISAERLEEMENRASVDTGSAGEAVHPLPSPPPRNLEADGTDGTVAHELRIHVAVAVQTCGRRALGAKIDKRGAWFPRVDVCVVPRVTMASRSVTDGTKSAGDGASFLRPRVGTLVSDGFSIWYGTKPWDGTMLSLN